LTRLRRAGYHERTLIRTRSTPLTHLFALVAAAWAVSGYTPPPVPLTDLNLQSATNCRPCHLDITEQWSSSSHSKADRGKNELFGRMYSNSLRETRGATLTKCGPCHETALYVMNDFDKMRPVSEEGVACVYCHAISGIGPADGVPPLTLELGGYLGTIRQPVFTTDHKSVYGDFLTKSNFCGGCHEYSNQHGILISDTFGEWKRSKYAKLGVTCQDCHMPGESGRNSPDGPVRPRVANHSFAIDASNPKLKNPATLALRLGKRGADSLRFYAVVANVGAGHSIPTGNDQHLLLIRVRVKDAEGKIIWENDPFQEWDASVFGLMLANVLGSWPAETWTAEKVIADRRIKAGGSAQVRYDIPLIDAKGALTVEAQLLHRRARPETVQIYGLDEETYGAERSMAEATLRVP